MSKIFGTDLGVTRSVDGSFCLALSYIYSVMFNRAKQNTSPVQRIRTGLQSRVNNLKIVSFIFGWYYINVYL